MNELSREEKIAVEKRTAELEKKYPIEGMYGSKCSLWQEGLRDGQVSKEFFALARLYYGRLWNYTGD